MSEAEKKRGKIVVVSTEHEAGAKLSGLGGIAALLRFSYQS
jgi:stalled ribosome rescue protein Dom34